MSGVVRYLNISLLRKYLPLSLSVKNFENWLTFGEVMGNSLVSCFLTHGVVNYCWTVTILRNVYFYQYLTVKYCSL